MDKGVGQVAGEGDTLAHFAKGTWKVNMMASMLREVV